MEGASQYGSLGIWQRGIYHVQKHAQTKKHGSDPHHVLIFAQPASGTAAMVLVRLDEE
jgi:hypothetical protein